METEKRLPLRNEKGPLDLKGENSESGEGLTGGTIEVQGGV